MWIYYSIGGKPAILNSDVVAKIGLLVIPIPAQAATNFHVVAYHTPITFNSDNYTTLKIYSTEGAAVADINNLYKDMAENKTAFSFGPLLIPQL